MCQVNILWWPVKLHCGLTRFRLLSNSYFHPCYVYHACAHTNRYCVGFTLADNIPSSHRYIIACSLPNWKQVLAFAVTAVLRVEIERSGRSRPTLTRDGVVKASILDTATPSKNCDRPLEALNCRRGTMYCNAATSWTAKQRLESQTRHLSLALKHTHYPLSYPFCWHELQQATKSKVQCKWLLFTYRFIPCALNGLQVSSCPVVLSTHIKQWRCGNCIDKASGSANS